MNMLSEKINVTTKNNEINNDIIDLSDAKLLFKQPSDWTSKDGSIIPHQSYKNFYEQI